MDINITFCRHLLSEVHREVKASAPSIKVYRDAWVYHFDGDHWEFHGPDEFYWHGSADNAYDARYHGWSAWLRQQKGSSPCKNIGS